KAIMHDNYTVPTDMWWSPNVLADVEKSLTPGTRYEPGNAMQLLNIPEKFLQMKLDGSFNSIQAHRDHHLDPVVKKAPTSPSSQYAPTKPTSVTPSTTSSTGNAWGVGREIKAGTY